MPGFLDALERYGRDQLTGDAAQAFEERLTHLRQIALNPAQLAFDAIMSLRSANELNAARAQHPLLGDRAFLDRLGEIAEQLGSRDAQAHLIQILEELKSPVR